jgi:hypothetical protein
MIHAQTDCPTVNSLMQSYYLKQIFLHHVFSAELAD